MGGLAGVIGETGDGRARERRGCGGTVRWEAARAPMLVQYAAAPGCKQPGRSLMTLSAGMLCCVPRWRLTRWSCLRRESCRRSVVKRYWLRYVEIGRAHV